MLAPPTRCRDHGVALRAGARNAFAGGLIDGGHQVAQKSMMTASREPAARARPRIQVLEPASSARRPPFRPALAPRLRPAEQQQPEQAADPAPGRIESSGTGSLRARSAALMRSDVNEERRLRSESVRDQQN
jgi:hypothetical protein